VGNVMQVYYTRRGDAPERVVMGELYLTLDWKQWRTGPAVEILKPETVYEGADLSITPSEGGKANGREHALRDPHIYEEGGKVYLLYAYAGESGIAIAEI
jgi:hypothetical protein